MTLGVNCNNTNGIMQRVFIEFDKKLKFSWYAINIMKKLKGEF